MGKKIENLVKEIQINEKLKSMRQVFESNLIKGTAPAWEPLEHSPNGYKN